MAVRQSKWTGLAYMAPALAFVGLFVMWPLCHLLWLSLTSESLLGGGDFVGLDNYVKAFGDRTFWQAFRFTLLYTAYLTPVLMGLGFALALLTASNAPLRRFTRMVIFLPVVIGLASSSQLWVWLFDGQVGLVNKLFVDLGLFAEPLVWFRTRRYRPAGGVDLGGLEGGRLRHDPDGRRAAERQLGGHRGRR